MEFRYESATCKLTEHGDGTADLTHVYAKNRGQGHASGLLRLVMEYVDSRELTVYLRVRAYGGPVQTMLSNEQLIKFYSKFGFEDKSDGCAVMALMIRTKNTPYSEREN